MIEGDNLEVLKLLQKSYAGKVKLIYIDPPYNTGHDFVYPDDFSDNVHNYLELTGQVSADGGRISSNTETSGRFHTAWLNMMYPRLKLARALLTEDGVLWATIDDHELAHLTELCDAIFGLENFVGIFIWEKRTTRENRKVFSVNHDYIVCYAREKSVFERVRCLLPRTEDSEERFSNPDYDPRGDWQSVSLNAQAGPGRRKEQFYTITTPSGRKVDPPSGRCWIYTEDRLQELRADNRIWFGEDR
jgi:adenine-specific DNA-methyltransferase